ncbi:hypothetical protein CYMTET_21719 [Cymbomonas tetramitiformis]|uniref:Uncharacterized protein n=1 Tax=Cymbomonas tetramitiformis TaxID=36881 RepID=A0AAE0G1L6_9CHLO|nr:hypothetical protein CYMTET_21719 [Cymbomonas tetramitiformis]
MYNVAKVIWLAREAVSIDNVIKSKTELVQLNRGHGFLRTFRTLTGRTYENSTTAAGVWRSRYGCRD